METQKIKLKTQTYQRVEKELEFELPTKTLYLFETGVRRSIRIVPLFFLSDLKYDEITEQTIEIPFEVPRLYRYVVTLVYQSYEQKIEQISIDVPDIARLWEDTKNKSLHRHILELIIEGHSDTRTKERFDKDFQSCLESFKSQESN